MTSFYYFTCLPRREHIIFRPGSIDRQAENGIYGYTESDQEYYDAVSSWMERRHGWEIDKEWITKTPGIVSCAGNGGKGLYRTWGLYSDPGSGLLSIPGSD